MTEGAADSGRLVAAERAADGLYQHLGRGIDAGPDGRGIVPDVLRDVGERNTLEHGRVVLRVVEVRLPPEVDPGERLARVGYPQLLLDRGRGLQGHVVVALGLIGGGLHGREGEIGAAGRVVLARSTGWCTVSRMKPSTSFRLDTTTEVESPWCGPPRSEEHTSELQS